MSQTLCKQNISRLMALLLAALLLISSAPAAAAAEGGACGAYLTWSLEGGTLTIAGEGDMYDYSESSMPPWYELRSQIIRISLPDGMTHIGNIAFYDCKSLGSVTIPGSVQSIGKMAFSNCSDITMVSFQEGLRTISDKAFEKCASLQDLRLPGTVTSIGNHAFYFCTSLSYVSIPGSVTSFGSGIFSYCDSLKKADFAVSADALPRWTFYGCDQLTVVNTLDGTVSASQLKVPNIPGGIQSETTPELEISTQVVNGSTTMTSQTVITPEGETAINDTIVKNTDNSTTVSTMTTTQRGGNTNVQSEVTATVINPEGWQDIFQQLESSQINLGTDSANSTTITVYDTQGSTISKEVLQELTGQNVTLAVQTQSGTQFKLDCMQIPEKIKKDLDLAYTLAPAEELPAEMEGCTVYKLIFHESADIKVEMIMRLPGDHQYQTASLYKLKKGEANHLQSVMVDADGNAHWYLRNIDHKIEYLIGINVPGAVENSPIIPAELAGVYKVANVYDGVEYVVTGRTSSWDMGLGKVMAILAVVMVSTISVVGIVMYIYNKRRLRAGNVLQWEDDDE